MPFFSVIIPTYNRLELQAQALTSVWAQTFTDYEVIVIDDGSTDGTWEELKALGSRVHAMRQPNAGPGVARNLGAHHASGDYLAFLDSDDLWFPWTLEVYQQVIKRTGGPAFVAGKPCRFQNEFFLSSAREEAVECQRFTDYLASGEEWRWWSVSSFVVRCEVFLSVKGFTKEWVNGEDADLALRLGTAAGFVQITAPVTFAYREHAVSAMKDFSRTLAGCWIKIRAERAGAYPGGRLRRIDRHRILTRHLRPASLDCLRHGLYAEAWQLYLATLFWHVRLGRWKYLLGFPMRALAAGVRRKSDDL
jgi:GT2 family glycosyltransferase